MPESNGAIYTAIVSNIAIAVSKFAAAAASGSSAMLSEGIHSLVDTGNGVLLLFGKRRSLRPPDDEHPFGHGKELYFWTLIVAVSVFGIGGGVSVLQGVMHLLRPEPPGKPLWNYVVLGVAALFDGVSFAVGVAQYRKENGGRNFWTALSHSKDPSNFYVVLEDGAALIGLLIAFFGVLLESAFGVRWSDGAASIAIGLLLAAVSLLLARESKGLLIGEGVDAQMIRDIREMAQQDAAVERAGRVLTMHFGPHTILVAMDLQFYGDIPASEVTAAIDRMEQRIRGRYSDVKRIFLEAETVPGHTPAASDDAPRHQSE